MRLLQSGWVTILLASLSYLGTTVVFMDPGKIFSGVNFEQPVEVGRVTGASWEFFDPEVDRLIEELTKEKVKLAKREETLTELERRLENERAEIIMVTQAVFQAQQEFDRNVVRVRQEETASFRRLAKTYAAMSPEAAIAILSELEDDQMIRILLFMKEDQIAGILEGISKRDEAGTKRAGVLAERLRTALGK